MEPVMAQARAAVEQAQWEAALERRNAMAAQQKLEQVQVVHGTGSGSRTQYFELDAHCVVEIILF